MSTASLIRRYFAPAATVAVIAGTAVLPRTVLHAEALDNYRKPIYDEADIITNLSPSNDAHDDETGTPQKSRSPTSIDRLAEQIKKSRLFLYAHVSALETKVNQVMDSAFDLEESFTGTIASLAPAPQTGERLMPGSLYVVVAAMAGSIAARKRNIVLRTTMPVAVAISAGWVLLPVTMRNISDLLWRYEQRFPALADSHIRSREAVLKSWRMARLHSEQTVNIVNEKISAGRGAVEDWVKKGK